MGKDWLLCSCGNRLGERMPGGLIAQRHKGRKILALLVSCTCEECGALWKADDRELERIRSIVGAPLREAA